jgi:hypothetical protein
MNSVFHAQFPEKIVPLAIVLPPEAGIELPELPPVPWTDNGGSLANQFFGALPVSRTPVATTDSATQKRGTDPATTESTSKTITTLTFPD